MKEYLLSGIFWLLEICRAILIRLGNRRGYRMPALLMAVNRFLRQERLPPAQRRNPSVTILTARSTRMLVVGANAYGTTSWARAKALAALYDHTASVNSTPLPGPASAARHCRINYLYYGSEIKKINQAVASTARAFRPDVLWVDKGVSVWPATLEEIRRRGCKVLVHYSPDNQTMRINQSRHYLRSIPVYDLHITTKAQTVGWLYKSGAAEVRLAGNGFDPDLHKPVDVTGIDQESFGCDIGFVGHWERDREEKLLWLYSKGYRIKVWGGNWEKAQHRRHPLFAGTRHLVGEEYAQAICGAKISLCLLSYWNADRATDRSVEIPACGQFMLAERTPEHQVLFKEGVEAEFYESAQEMLDKIRYYLVNEAQRKKIGEMGRRRALAGYSNEARLKSVVMAAAEPVRGGELKRV
ncbi:MAG: glycosyltransferase [Candidatus Omnitrophota bacterium]